MPTPAHSSVAGALTYRSELALAPGTLVRVPLGRRDVLGIVWDGPVDAVFKAIAGRTVELSAAFGDTDSVGTVDIGDFSQVTSVGTGTDANIVIFRSSIIGAG